MLRFIIPLACFLLVSLPSYAEDEYTFAGITLLEEPLLPFCQEFDNEAIKPLWDEKVKAGEIKDVEDVATFFTTFLKEDCIINHEFLGRDRYRAFFLSPPELISGVPIGAAFINVDRNNRIFLITLYFDTSLYEEVLSYIESEYGAPHSTKTIRTSVDSNWRLNDNTQIFLSSKERNPITKQEYTSLGIMNLSSRARN